MPFPFQSPSPLSCLVRILGWDSLGIGFLVVFVGEFGAGFVERGLNSPPTVPGFEFTFSVFSFISPPCCMFFVHFPFGVARGEDEEEVEISTLFLLNRFLFPVHFLREQLEMELEHELEEEPQEEELRVLVLFFFLVAFWAAFAFGLAAFFADFLAGIAIGEVEAEAGVSAFRVAFDVLAIVACWSASGCKMLFSHLKACEKTYFEVDFPGTARRMYFGFSMNAKKYFLSGLILASGKAERLISNRPWLSIESAFCRTATGLPLSFLTNTTSKVLASGICGGIQETRRIPSSQTGLFSATA